MNIEIANRLVELRKKNGYSQEELASKLGLSRQAVSKWERAEASPDTDNLICLAKLYGVSLDDLLKTNESVETIVNEQVNSDNCQQVKKENEEDKEEEKDPRARKLRLIEAIVSGALTLIITIIYVTLGCLFDSVWPDPMVWKYLWVAYLLIPFVSSIFEGIIKKKFDCFTGAIVMGVVITYISLGFFLGAWHPGWVVFLLIPLYAGVASAVDKAIAAKKE